MKRLTNFLLAASAVLALASCEKFATMNSSTPDNGEIRFGTTGIRVETKAFSETTVNTLENDGFNVAAIIDLESEAMFNKAVAYESATGLYTVPNEHYYYPNTGTMSFYAAHPLGQAITIGEDGGAASLVYSQDADTDLVAAKATAVAKQPTAVMLTFDHLLSQIDVTAKGENATVDYKLKNVTVTAPDGGTYTYADDKWTLSNDTVQHDVYRTVAPADDMTVSTGETATPVGGAMTFLPDDVSINVVWECFNKVDKSLISSNDQTISVDLIRGKHSTLNLILPSNASEIMFTLEVNPWVTESRDIIVQPAASYTVNAAAGATVTLPALNMADNTKGYMNWGDGTVEHFNNAGTKSSVAEGQLTLSHEYAAAFAGSAQIFVETGSLRAVLIDEELVKFTVSEPEKVSVTQYIPGVFTVNASGKKVMFAPGNLYWDGSTFKFEEHQYSCPLGSPDANHVGHFRWSKDPRVACTIHPDAYEAANIEFGITPSVTDTLFAINGGAIEGYTVLSEAEWMYMWDRNIKKDRSVSINQMHCLILKPDGFDGTLAEVYTAAAWAELEEKYGLVALPCSGESTNFISGPGATNFYWFSTPDDSDKDRARCIYFTQTHPDYPDWRCFENGEGGIMSRAREVGHAIRLVKVIDPGN